MFGPPLACPVCHGFEFRQSRSGIARYFAILIGLRPFRCYACNARIWRFSLSGKTHGKRWKTSTNLKPITKKLDTPIEPATA